VPEAVLFGVSLEALSERICLAGHPGEIELRGRAGNPQDLLMSMTAAVPSLTLAARPGRGQQQRGRGQRPILGRL
jgi:hypothetical protein